MGPHAGQAGKDHVGSSFLVRPVGVPLAWVDQDQLAGPGGALGDFRVDPALDPRVGGPLPVAQNPLGDDHRQGKRVPVLGDPLAGGEAEAHDAHGAAVGNLFPAECARLHPSRIIIASVSWTETPAQLLVLSRADVERLLDQDQLLDALAAAFRLLSAGRVSVPPRVAARSQLGMLAVMPGYVPDIGLEAKLVSVFPENHARGLPSHQALVALFDPESGRPLALLDGTHITAVRTAAAAALSVRLLARPEAQVLAVLGAGVQGHAHLGSVQRVRDFHEVRIASRNPDHARALATTSRPARAMHSFEEAVRGADVVCCCTDSAEPVITYSWLSPGAHVTSVGANPGGPELDAETVRRGRLFVESRVAFQAPPAGSAELTGLDPQGASELGEVLDGRAAGRRTPDEITVYKSMGHAVEDAAAAQLVYVKALREGAGQRVFL